MSLALLAQSYMATARMSDNAMTMFGANQSRMGLANNVSANMSQQQTLSVAKQDQALQMQSMNAAVMFAANQAMAEGSKNATKKWAESFGLMGGSGQ